MADKSVHERMADALERIADVLEAQAPPRQRPAPAKDAEGGKDEPE